LLFCVAVSPRCVFFVFGTVPREIGGKLWHCWSERSRHQTTTRGKQANRQTGRANWHLALRAATPSGQWSGRLLPFTHVRWPLVCCCWDESAYSHDVSVSIRGKAGRWWGGVAGRGEARRGGSSIAAVNVYGDRSSQRAIESVPSHYWSLGPLQHATCRCSLFQLPVGAPEKQKLAFINAVGYLFTFRHMPL